MTFAEEIVMATLEHFVSKDWKVKNLTFDNDDHYHVTLLNTHTQDTYEIAEYETAQDLPSWVRPVLAQVRLFFSRYPRGETE